MSPLLPRTSIVIFFLYFVTFSSCKKEVSQNPEQSNTPAAYFLKGFLGPEEITIQNSSSYFTDASRQNSGNPHGGDHNGDGHVDNGQHDSLSTTLDDDNQLYITGCSWQNTNEQGIITTTGTVELRKEVFRIYITPSADNPHFDMLKPGIYNFASDDNASEGAFITVRDKDGVLWTSAGDQGGSTFEIQSREGNNQTFARVTGSVSCKMYDSSGNMKPLTSATFIANFGL
jgi:hypothetical protein